MVITIRDIAKFIGILLLQAYFTSNCTLKVDKTKDRYEYKPLINCLKGLPKTISKYRYQLETWNHYFEQKRQHLVTKNGLQNTIEGLYLQKEP